MDENEVAVTDPGAPAMPRPRTDRTRIRRHDERGVPERIEEFLRAGLVAHVAYVQGGEPRVIPFLYHYETGRIILHGAPGSSTLGAIRDGRPVAISVTLLDGLIASRDAENHSANYRSVVAYGRARRVRSLDEKRALLEAMTARYFPGRRPPLDYAPATEPQLKALEVLVVDVEEAQAKTRSGPPNGPQDGDPDAPGSAFVKPV